MESANNMDTAQGNQHGDTKNRGQKRSPPRSKSATERSAQSRMSANAANIDKMLRAKVLYVLDTHEPDVFPIEIASNYPEDTPEDVNMHNFLQNMARATAGNRNNLDSHPPQYTQLNFDALKVAGVAKYDPHGTLISMFVCKITLSGMIL